MSELLREIGMISRALEDISNKEFKELHLNKGQYVYLARIVEHPGIINDSLAECTRSDRTSVAKSVKNLEKEGLVRKESDVENKKIRRLYATNKGVDLYQILAREERYSEKKAIAGLTIKEQNQLLSLLKHVNQNVTDDWLYVKSGKKRTY
ncbi:MarR family winged helix-turn-helix transcriptional regulator [Enterococcus phoeniculicola]|jgi:DNA-binding MarR family transcriptional regulator|uniref:HTH marR-type domain-containing protein n=1 Tax=Enterococcus phoeniculicola ATCC BAA-412 TaxID=1158610 RepID=R3W522_9ENTE|nr:MarR family transcriptional regulator [Enterococcus phoeniculicola]EOL42671.1 hypothetical protein UC3_03024 [Enterococcus phoeniculicola ATCC BAA-412]EOT79045.1 hypothetical protein I589_00552 [Enterococcus phoeniculicola ATCC BAA-412]